MLTLTLIRGVPGSGKTTVAKGLCRMTNAIIFEADMYFMTKEGYKFEGHKLRLAHDWCRNITKEALANGVSVIVSNTFTRKWEMAPYLDLAREHGATLQIIEVQGYFDNIHGVPHEHVQSMRARWEPFTLEAP